ncbi:hypothetical protein J1605_017051 [Eschrichtius robustus]|uniref:Aminopeptidase N n=1 Tax=Eschrichtius robustus TaxID=9764 RepID=A0AB34I2Q6_ESCRO|nr:hypothetical protein J1605_017051 [Eschrichtius robustus]
MAMSSGQEEPGQVGSGKAIGSDLQSLWEAGRPLRFRDGNWSVQGPRPELGPGSQSYPSSPPLSLALAQRPQNDLFKTQADEWVLLNVNVTGYYQVNYDENNWRKIQNQLQIKPLTIPVINRAQIIYDSFNLASAHIVPVTLALNNTLFLINEKEYMPWQAALSSLRYFKLMFDRSEVYGPMKNYLRNQVEPLFLYFENLTKNWTLRPESLMDQYNEINAISTACSNGLPKCEELAKNLYNQWMEDPQNNPIHPNLRSTIYCNAIAQGDQKEWDFAWRQLQQVQLVNEADKLRSALACTNKVWLLNRYLSYTLKPDLIRKQDATSTINSIASNVLGQSLAWDFVQSNWKKLFQDYGGGSFSFSNLIQAVTRRFSTEFELQQLEQFKKNNMDVGFGSGTRALEQALEKTKANIKWVKENKEGPAAGQLALDLRGTRGQAAPSGGPRWGKDQHRHLGSLGESGPPEELGEEGCQIPEDAQLWLALAVAFSDWTKD